MTLVALVGVFFVVFDAGAHLGGAATSNPSGPNAGNGGYKDGGETGSAVKDAERLEMCNRRVKSEADPAKKSSDDTKIAAEDACPDMTATLQTADSNLAAEDDCLQTNQSLADVQKEKFNALRPQIAKCKSALKECVDDAVRGEKTVGPLRPICSDFVPRLPNSIAPGIAQNKETCESGTPKRNLIKMEEELNKALTTAGQAKTNGQSCVGGGNFKIDKDLDKAIAERDTGTTPYRDQNQQMIDEFNRNQEQTPVSQRSELYTGERTGERDAARVDSGDQGAPTNPGQNSPGPATQSPQAQSQQPPQQQSPQQQQQQPPQQPQSPQAQQQPPKSDDSKAAAASTDPKTDTKDQTATTGAGPLPLTPEQLAAAPGHSETPGSMAQAAAAEEKNKAAKPAPLAFVVGGIKGGGTFSPGGGSGGFGGLTPAKNTDDEDEKLLAAKGLRKPASVLGETSGGGGGGGKGGWLSSLLGGKSENGSSSSYFSKFFGGNSDDKPGSKVDLSQFLPGGKIKLDFRSIAGNGRPAGVHGPHVILWNAVNDRYRSLETTLITEP